MTPRTLPNGSTTDAVTKPGPRSVIGSYAVAPRDSSRSKAAAAVVHVPVDHRAAGPPRGAGGGETAVDDAELVLVVADRNST